jgi:spore coat polysaccharide biosynthesis predicted glycosyltransferase SpsG/GNAT superfamily N-acetyltransferase
MRVLLRCDGGGSLGVGHVMRSLALAEAAVAAGHDVVVAGHFEGSFVRGQLAAAPVEVVQLGSAAAAGTDPRLKLFERFQPEVLHVDSYDMSHWFMGSFILSSMEDGSFGRRRADVVVDPTLGAELGARPDDGSTWLLRGSRYAPVRRRVVEASRRAVDVAASHVGGRDVARAVMVVMGGTDPVGLAPVAVRLLARTGLALHVTAIAGAENADMVREAALGSALSLTVQGPADDLAEMMSRKDLVVSAAGTSVWELCCLGVPMAVIRAVDNQREGYGRLVEAGAAVGLGGPELGGPGQDVAERAVGLLRSALTDPAVRAGLVVAGRHLVDGLGAWRVVRTWEQALRLRAPASGRAGAERLFGRLTARPAVLDDARLLWEWRNDLGTRAGSRNADVVPWPEHRAWLESTLRRPDRLLLVVEDQISGVSARSTGSTGTGNTVGTGSGVGTARWDRQGDGEWEVSITVAPDRRGQSLASPLLHVAEEVLSEVARSRATRVTAYLAVVNGDNAASVRLFETSGYVPDLPPDPRGFMQFRKAAQVA